MENIEELESYLNAAVQQEVWGNLSARSAAWANMRKNGEMPNDVQFTSYGMETDLLEYGFSVLRAALRYRELNGNEILSKKAFNVIGRTFESLTTNSSMEAAENDFYKIIAGTSYHLAGYSAMAYSILNYPGEKNLTPLESALRQLILRNINGLTSELSDFLNLKENSDISIIAMLSDNKVELDMVLASILNIAGCKGLSYFEFALQTGDNSLLHTAKGLLSKAIKLAKDSGTVTHFWVLRLITLMLDDLWSTSLHVTLPVEPPGESEDYQELRELFIASLYKRKTAEIELWPSQIEAARRALDLADDLVVALPTSAGKTRIAEITALMTLSTGKRVLIVTPLRALSAQTEQSFRKSFSPLGFRVSSLYGPSGSSGDGDALRTNDVIISTPEKLDFAIRNDPTILNDIGLVILDEGHMIGENEREIRFEVLVQKLLRRGDAEHRRIVCLSAILPSGDPLKELTAWIRNDAPGEPVSVPWRPTRQRFGTLTFYGDYAKLNYGQQDSEGFITKFVESNPNLVSDPKLRSGDIKDITLASAWKFALEGKRVLVFITQANWVEGFGRVAMDLVKRGFLNPLLEDIVAIERAVQIGEEWLGTGHPAVESLKIGIAIHHGKLPSPFLREVEILLTTGAIKVTIASPTLSQGLNINAGVLLVPYLTRSGVVIPGEEFANVAGRAGRAFVDVEGLVLHVVKDKIRKRHSDWFGLVRAARTRHIESGLMLVMTESIRRLASVGVIEDDDSFEYLANSTDAWKGLSQNAVGNGLVGVENTLVESQLEKLDTIVFGLIEALDADTNNLAQIIDSALTSSLWERQVAKLAPDFRKYHRMLLLSRARLIWNNTTTVSRQGYFAMGVGLDSGLKIDQIANNLGGLLDVADTAALAGDVTTLSDALISMAQSLLVLSPFKSGDEFPENWRDLLRKWLNGDTVDLIGISNMKFIENEFVYRLVWALESIRVKRLSAGWVSDHITGAAASCLETGVHDYHCALLIRAGLPSRITAQLVVGLINPSFRDGKEMREWLRSDQILKLTNNHGFPSAITSKLWRKFQQDIIVGNGRKLSIHSVAGRNLKDPKTRPQNGIYRLVVDVNGNCRILTPDFKEVSMLNRRIVSGTPGMINVRFVEGNKRPLISRIGPGKIRWSET